MKEKEKERKREEKERNEKLKIWEKGVKKQGITIRELNEIGRK
jgi:DNA-binding protein H-NS